MAPVAASIENVMLAAVLQDPWDASAVGFGYYTDDVARLQDGVEEASAAVVGTLCDGKQIAVVAWRPALAWVEAAAAMFGSDP